MSGTQQAIEMYGGDEYARRRYKKGVEHNEDIERAFLFGERYLDPNTDKPKRTTRGLVRWVEEGGNVEDMQGSMSEEDFMTDWAEMAFEHGDDEKLLLCSKKLISEVSSWGRENLQTTSGEETYGIRTTRLITPHGDFMLVRHNFLENQEYSAYGISVDMSAVKARPLRGRDTALKPDIHGNDVDGQIDQYLTELGLQVEQPERHAILKNF